MTTIKGSDPLISAIEEQKDISLIRKLIAEGADINVVTKICYNFDDVRNTEAIKSLYNEEGFTPLHYAADVGNSDVIELLLKHGANINVTSKCGKRALDVAVDRGNTKIIRLLLENGAESDFADNVGCTHLHFAVKHGYIEVIKFLLDNGTKIDVTDGEGSTPLHYAAYERVNRMIKFLIEHGADINVTNKSGQIPLHLAVCRFPCITTVKLLLEYGSKIDVTDNNGYKPIDLARNNGHTKVVKLLELEQLIEERTNSKTVNLKQLRE